ncbi:MAG: acyl-CoA dehydrogenase [Gemmatimonadales bacterium]|nr:MAG: acyl-CoA dehydrogenase [Gemmatimonadales bacterium]
MVTPSSKRAPSGSQVVRLPRPDLPLDGVAGSEFAFESPPDQHRELHIRGKTERDEMTTWEFAHPVGEFRRKDAPQADEHLETDDPVLNRQGHESGRDCQRHESEPQHDLETRLHRGIPSEASERVDEPGQEERSGHEMMQRIEAAVRGVVLGGFARGHGRRASGWGERAARALAVTRGRSPGSHLPPPRPTAAAPGGVLSRRAGRPHHEGRDPRERPARPVRQGSPPLQPRSARMSSTAEGIRQSREVAESAREKGWEKASFMRDFFQGRFRLDLLHPLPPPDPEEQARASPFLASLEAFARDHLDGDAVDRDGWVPEQVLDGLRELGAFGIKIPERYGGLGLSQLSYARALGIVAGRCASTGAFLSAHQSIGVPQPVLLFGTDAQKERWLPRIARGALSAFALTEPEVGSDPANLATEARLSDDGSHWILNGEKLWCTNGPRAELLVVMARTPPREGVRGKRPITAFVVERSWEGVEVAHTCHFMGLKGISNGVLRFSDVKIPLDHVLLGEGEGLRLALVTLNTGRLSLPAFCATSGRLLLEISRRWAASRVQWGQPVGRHDAVAQKLGRMAADTYAMEAGMELTSRMADLDTFDLRLEAALTKLWHTETAWRVANDALQIRGGRGYETADSLRGRGEEGIPVERALRDLRINLIFEGTSEIMRLFIAREAVDPHLQVAGDLVDAKAPPSKRLQALGRAGVHYAGWYPTRWVGWGWWPRYGEFGRLAPQLRFVERTSRRLSRTVFHAMVRHGAGLERRQAVLGRLVDVGAEAFLMTAVCLDAHRRMAADPSDGSPGELADTFCLQARRRIGTHFREVFGNDDVATYAAARRTLAGRYTWLEDQGVGSV